MPKSLLNAQRTTLTRKQHRQAHWHNQMNRGTQTIGTPMNSGTLMSGPADHGKPMDGRSSEATPKLLLIQKTQTQANEMKKNVPNMKISEPQSMNKRLSWPME